MTPAPGPLSGNDQIQTINDADRDHKPAQQAETMASRRTRVRALQSCKPWPAAGTFGTCRSHPPGPTGAMLIECVIALFSAGVITAVISCVLCCWSLRHVAGRHCCCCPGQQQQTLVIARSNRRHSDPEKPGLDCRAAADAGNDQQRSDELTPDTNGMISRPRRCL